MKFRFYHDIVTDYPFYIEINPETFGIADIRCAIRLLMDGKGKKPHTKIGKISVSGKPEDGKFLVEADVWVNENFHLIKNKPTVLIFEKCSSEEFDSAKDWKKETL